MLSAGQWYHIVASVGATYGQKLHINGVERATNANTAAHTGASKNFLIGDVGEDGATIRIDEPAAFVSEISEAQASTLYASR